jgi:peptidoglycan hydrolase CwlO-like protein
MLAKENADLQDEIQEMLRQIDQVNREKEEQRKRYEGQIKGKDDIIN